MLGFGTTTVPAISYRKYTAALKTVNTEYYVKHDSVLLHLREISRRSVRGHPPYLTFLISLFPLKNYINPYPTAFPYGNGMVLHFYQQQESSTAKTVHKVINKRLKTYV